jgi:hypothetical protein
MISQRTVAAVTCGIETGDLGKIGKSVEKHPDRREIVRRCSGAKEIYCSSFLRTFESTITGALYSGPPCTTRCPTAIGFNRCSLRSH